ncbi:Deoxyhypusine synthase [Mariprofundus ferrinatatus]|uniref:Deoxyhypusine synthase n=1 Tax=Mariprofundus ferrinatatus TaxID=1921087 RepID=A0A2K8L260_9PROT|nr:deoxyhypusine synthase family protein [Mariprofundus ferrinatatus]ATX81333.1 Deoxyhypusine synthase [Mariprofundus ferrinatatus]
MTVKPLSFAKMKPVPIAKRKVESDGMDFAAPYRAGSGFESFLCSLPNLGCAADLFRLRDAIVTAHRHKKQVILACGGHVLESGLGPLICRLIEQRIITGLALTGAALEQDVEIAILGHTVAPSERELNDGRYCLTEETGCLINDAINYGTTENWGIGKSVGKRLLESEFEHLEYSVIATAERYGTPVSVHPAIGADAFGMHPASHGESLGASSFRDFRLLAGMLAECSSGVIVNIASSVVMPRVLLQALDAARNVGKSVGNVTTAIIDPAASSSAITDVIERLTRPDGEGYWLTGPDEIIVPLLFASVLEALGDEVG